MPVVKEEQKLCIIGAGPCALSLLYHMRKRLNSGQPVPASIKCFDKIGSIGGNWNLTTQTGLDETGDPVNSAMYKHMWLIAPREAQEYPDYSHERHFGTNVPSFLPRKPMIEYILGRSQIEGPIDQWIHLRTRVESVSYCNQSDLFTVTTKHLDTGVSTTETFNWVVVATGHFSHPRVPDDVDGVDSFTGRVIHSSEVRDFDQFVGKRVLCVGTGFSGIDITTQCVKYGAASVTISNKKARLNFGWPSDKVQEASRAVSVWGPTVTFADGKKDDFDVIVWCTGYNHSFPFLDSQLKLKTANVLYPNHLYKGVVFTQAADHKLFYMGMQNLVYSFPLYDLQAQLIVKLLSKEHSLPSRDQMAEDIEGFRTKEQDVSSVEDMFNYQSDYMIDLADTLNVPCQADRRHLLHKWWSHFKSDPLNYRDRNYESQVTGNKGAPKQGRFVDILDEESRFNHLLMSRQKEHL